MNAFRARSGLEPLRHVSVIDVAWPFEFAPSLSLGDPAHDEDNVAWFTGTRLLSADATQVQINRNIKAITALVG
jgi:hypothetical protein